MDQRTSVGLFGGRRWPGRAESVGQARLGFFIFQSPGRPETIDNGPAMESVGSPAIQSHMAQSHMAGAGRLEGTFPQLFSLIKLMHITDYDSLLSAAKQQAEPQRLLFVFLKASLPHDHGDDPASRSHAGQGGELHPVMCVDKTLDELGRFADLVAESERTQQDWHIVLIAALSGRQGVLPTSDEAELPLRKMMQDVESGGDLSKYMAFDREGTPIQFG